MPSSSITSPPPQTWLPFSFPYGCESWTIKKAESQRINAFKLWCWRRPLRIPWTAKKSNQSIFREINLEYSWEGLMLKLKLQDFGHGHLTMPSSRGSSQLRDQTQVSCIAGGFFTVWTTREAHSLRLLKYLWIKSYNFFLPQCPRSEKSYKVWLVTPGG